MLSPRFRVAVALAAAVFIAAIESPISPAAADRLQRERRSGCTPTTATPRKGCKDRLDRALAVRSSGVAIEQDVAWFVDPATGRGRSVVSHDAKPDGTEPTLESHSSIASGR